MIWLLAPLALLLLIAGHRRRLRLAHEADRESAWAQVHIQHQRRLKLLAHIRGDEVTTIALTALDEAALALGAAQAAEALAQEDPGPAHRELIHVEARLKAALSLSRALSPS